MPLGDAPITDADWDALLGPAADATTEGLLVQDHEGTIRAANIAASMLLGVTRSALLGTSPYDPRFRPLTPDGERLPAHEHPSIVALDTGTPQRDVHLPLERRDGRRQWLSWNAVPVFSSGSSRPYAVVTSFFDITSLVEARERLEASEREVRLLAEHSGDLIALHDDDGRITYAAGAAEQLVGLTREQLVGLLVLDVCHRDDRPAVEAAEAAVREGRSGTVTYRVPHGRTGEWIWLESTITPVPEADNAVVTTRNVTDRVHAQLAEREAAEERRRHQALLEEAQAMADLGSWVFDLRTGETWFSPGLHRIFGLDPAAPPAWELHARHIHADDRRTVERTLLQAVETGEPFDITYRAARADDGRERLFHGRGAPADVEDGRIVRVWGTTQDITGRHEVEAGRREAERLFRVAFERAPIGLALTRFETGEVLRANDALGDLLGCAPDELVGCALKEFTHPDDLERSMVAVGPLVRGEVDEVQFEKRYVRRDGTVVWALASVASVVDDDGTYRFSVSQIVDITERKRFEGQLRRLADHDALTGLFNRRRFEEELERVLAEAERYDRHGAVLVLDLDGFKVVNDTLGHSMGDRLIGRLAATLRAELRESDVIARLGGDEFGVILPEADEEQAAAVAEKLRRAVERDGAVAEDDRHARVTASTGVAMFAGGDGTSAEELLVDADIAMYDAKEDGRNRATVHRRLAPGAGRHVSRLTWLDRIRRALAEDRMELHAQPLVPLAGDDGFERYELLVRMRGDDGELIPPAAFLPVAERFDVIQDIDRWVVARAVELLRGEHAAGNPVSFGVNLSGRTVGDAAFASWLEELLVANPVSSNHLIFELTETAAVVNLDRARTLAETLRRLGCQLALDDFGAGFASFAYLKHLPFDCLKIDGEYVRGLAENETDRVVVQAIVTIAKGMGAVTLAEFVTDEAVLQVAQELGVDFGQGFHLGRPVPVEQVLRGAAAGLRP